MKYETKVASVAEKLEEYKLNAFDLLTWEALLNMVTEYTPNIGSIGGIGFGKQIRKEILEAARRKARRLDELRGDKVTYHSSLLNSLVQEL